MLKCYTLRGSTLYEGIMLENDVIRIGEIGRGRRQSEITPPRGSVISGVRLLQVPSESAGYLVKLCGLAGFRGSAKVEHQGQVIAEGYEAQGDAGFMGGAEALLIMMPNTTEIHVSRSGRTYGENKNIILKQQDERLIATNPVLDSLNQEYQERMNKLCHES